MKRGTQIIYKPAHAKDLNDPACEKGFVTSGPTNEGAYFCRFWLQNSDGTLLIPCELRTKANSESCSKRHLVEKDTVLQALVEEMLERYC